MKVINNATAKNEREHGSVKIPTIEELGITLHGSLAQLAHHVHIDHAPDSPHVRCFVTLKVRNAESDDPGNVINVTSCQTLHYFSAEVYNLAAWRAWVCGVIRMAWQHELDEGLKIDGRHVNPPHEPMWTWPEPALLKVKIEP